MRKGGGKQKGASFERQVCRELSLWLSHGSQEDCFWRSAMSGGRSTVAAQRGKRLASQAGDISAINELGAKFANLFLVECKHYASLDLQGLISGNGKLLEFWLQVRRQANMCGKHPLLIAKQNRLATIVCMTKGGYQALNLAKSVVLVAPTQDMWVVLLKNYLKNAARP